MSSALMPPYMMTVPEFLAWNAPGPGRWRLVEGQPVAMAPASRTHGALVAELGSWIGNCLPRPCSAVAFPGIIPRVRANENFRIPALAVPARGSKLRNPVLIEEVLSPSNRAEIWRNVWSYTTVPSLREILILSSTAIRAELLRRGEDGNWPATSTVIEDGDLMLDSIGLVVSLTAIYRTTRFARD